MSEQQHRLVVLTGEFEGQELLIKEHVNTLGRADTNELCLKVRAISRKHCQLILDDDGSVILSDLGSVNGTELNGESVSSQKLKDGDVICVGDVELKFLFSGADEEDEDGEETLFLDTSSDANTPEANTDKTAFMDATDLEESLNSVPNNNEEDSKKQTVMGKDPDVVEPAPVGFGLPSDEDLSTDTTNDDSETEFMDMGDTVSKMDEPSGENGDESADDWSIPDSPPAGGTDLDIDTTEDESVEEEGTMLNIPAVEAQAQGSAATAFMKVEDLNSATAFMDVEALAQENVETSETQFMDSEDMAKHAAVIAQKVQSEGRRKSAVAAGVIFVVSVLCAIFIVYSGASSSDEDSGSKKKEEKKMHKAWPVYVLSDEEESASGAKREKSAIGYMKQGSRLVDDAEVADGNLWVALKYFAHAKALLDSLDYSTSQVSRLESKINDAKKRVDLAFSELIKDYKLARGRGQKEQAKSLLKRMLALIDDETDDRYIFVQGLLSK